ncbi:HAD family hydrolase [Candidatus Woesearchaeota archaeon]|nr:HAD family hydrolase [Candidatus Woesearchaeota archaeon]
MVKIVFFDVGDTLVACPQFLSLFCEKLGRPGDQELYAFLRAKFYEHYSKKDPPIKTVLEMFEYVLACAYQELGLPDLSRSARELEEEVFIDRGKLMEGARENLEFLKSKGVRLFVLSDADDFILKPELINFRIDRFFEDFVISNIVGAYKPSDSIVAAALKHCEGVGKDEICVVGDADVDVQTARKMGVKSIRLNTSHRSRKESADHVFNDLKELLAFWKQKLP